MHNPNAHKYANAKIYRQMLLELDLQQIQSSMYSIELTAHGTVSTV